MEQTNEILVNDNPKSSFSESIKTIRTNLKFAAIDNKIKSILITSPEPGDGKSFITANLATAFAQENKNIQSEASNNAQQEQTIAVESNFTSFGNIFTPIIQEMMFFAICLKFQTMFRMGKK